MSANSKPQAPTINSWLRSASDTLDTSGVPTPRLDAELILAHTLDRDRTWLHSHGDEIFELRDEADTLLVRRAQRMPIAYITGYKEFYGRGFRVTPDVLIPRPETEVMIELAKSYRVNGAVLDVGCGSGAIGITLALELPVQATLSDISPAALDVARDNATNLGAHIEDFVTSDLLAHWVIHKNLAQFDTIVANLPYVSRDWGRSPETEHEPALALFAEDDGLSIIKKLIVQTPKVLKQSGYLFLEADPEQHEAIIVQAKKSGLALETTQDYIIVLRQT